MKYLCVVNTHLGGYQLLAGQLVPKKWIESAGDVNLQSLLSAGFVVESGGEEEVPADVPAVDPAPEAPVPEAKPKKGKK